MAVGTNVARKDGVSKVSGTALYTDDLNFPGMLHARTVRSTVPHGQIQAIELDFDSTGFSVVRAEDIPGKNVITLIGDDQPCLSDGTVRHVGEPVLLLAHEDRERLWQADVRIAYRELQAVFEPRESDRVFKKIEITKGSVDEGMRAADVVVEGEYRTGHQEQLYIENNAVIAVPENGGVTIHGSMQCPYYIHKALRILLDLPPERVRVVARETGGGFGGKEEYPSMIAGHAALLALKSNRPVKLIYDREEDLVATTKRHPSVCRIRTGLKRDGRLTATAVDVLIDGGAYVTLSPVVLSRGVIHAGGPYRCPHLRIVGRAVRTNTPPNGAFRGFGAPQTQFAMEVHMERVAEELGLDPVELRRRNALLPGDTNATGQVMGPDCSALEVLKEAVRRSGYRRKRRDYPKSGRGIGLALIYHGSGFTGSGEVMLDSEAALEVTEHGVRILVASTEIGQGTRTMHAQIVADSLGIPYEQVETDNPDTARVPDSGPTVASRTCMVVGAILQRCCRDLKTKLRGLTPGEYFRLHGRLKVARRYQRPPGLSWDEEHYRGDAYATYAYACVVSEIEIDRDTYQVRPLRITSVQDIGRAIHPVLAAGQVEGGVAQGLGFGLYEEVVMRDGAMANAQMTNYIIPTTLDTPEIDVHFVNRPYADGPYGAKGVGELPIDGPAPSLVNALRHLGLDVRAIPATPERIMEAACASV